MSRVVLVHGAFNELWGPNELRSRWMPALRDGLWHHGVEIDDADVGTCFYGDLYRLDPEKVDPDEWAASRAGTAEMLQELGGEALLEMLSQAASAAAFDRTVDMVTIMSTNPDVRHHARDRLLALIDDDTRVIVGHSMGSVVAHQVLADNPQIEVDTLVTLGSPLGTAMIKAMLQPAADGPLGPWPGSTRRWVNVAAVGDRATGDGRLADHFGSKVQDHRIDNGHRAHDPEPYLNAAVTGAAVARAIA